MASNYIAPLNNLPLLRFRPGGVWPELVVQRLPGAKVGKNLKRGLLKKNLEEISLNFCNYTRNPIKFLHRIESSLIFAAAMKDRLFGNPWH